MIVYNRLWETMKRKKISQYYLIHTYGFSAGQLHRIKKNMYISTHTIDVLCRLLDCAAEDILEYKPEPDCANPLPESKPKQNHQYNKL